MNSIRCRQCKHFIIANAGEGKIYGCARSKCVFEPTTKNDLGVDCISRTSALDSINWAYNLRDAYQKINDLPSVTPQESRWIPVSEKLPNDRFTNTVGWELRAKTPEEIKKECSEIIQQKINKLKGNENGND